MIKILIGIILLIVSLSYLLVKDACDHDFDIDEALGFSMSYGGEQCVSKKDYIYIVSPFAEFKIILDGYYEDFEKNILDGKSKRWKKQHNSNCWERMVYFESDSLVTIASFCSGNDSVEVQYFSE